MQPGDDHPLIRLIIDTGHLLGVHVTAEGVETHMQATELTALGVDTLQGYLFGRPAEPTNFVENANPSAKPSQHQEHRSL